MKHWHQQLLHDSGLYRRWHEYSHHSKLHWAVLLVVAFFLFDLTIMAFTSNNSVDTATTLIYPAPSVQPTELDQMETPAALVTDTPIPPTSPIEDGVNYPYP